MSAGDVNDQVTDLRCDGIDKLDFEESLVTAFERTAAIFSSRIALSSDGGEQTYRELNETANRLAHRLVACGVFPEGRIAILMAQDVPMVAAVLGVLKAGQIVVALNPGDPPARLKALVENAQPSIIVTDLPSEALATELAAELAPKFGPLGCRILTFEAATAPGPHDNLSIKIPPAQTAFLTYTSGTTGRPKGVMQTHRQLRRAAAAHSEAMQYTQNDRIPLFALISTGQGAVGLWWILLNGAALCPFPLKTRGVTGLADWIIKRRLTVYVSSASIFRTLVATIDDRLVFSNVRAVRLASEGVTGSDLLAFRKHFPPTSILVHGLSSSETSNIAWSRWTQDNDIPEGVLPVGHFSRDMDITLGNDDGQPVARGEVGEILVKSRYVAAGYWRDPQLTAERFSDDLDGHGTRLVRTGDLARINADGLLEFCGRKDDRIKIRGNRIEPLDIERTLEGLPGIERAAVVAVRFEKHEPLLVAFVVKTGDSTWAPPRLRRVMRANLPEHMVPSRFVFLDSLPYNRGNKIDREALRQYCLPVRDDSKGETPRTETETLIANIWAELFELPDLGRDDDFFNLGGDSLKGAVVAAQVHAALGVELSLGAIADHPTVSALAAFIDQCRDQELTGTPPIVRVARAAAMPLSLAQASQWLGSQGLKGTIARRFRVTGPLDTEIFKECLRYLVGRHEILRTTIGPVDGALRQIIHPTAPLDFSVIDLSDSDDAEHRADQIAREVASRVIDLTTLPIMRHLLIKIAKDDYRLIRISHLLISDGNAARILDAELATLYDARLHGIEPPLPKNPPLQYVDYTVWQHELMRPDGPHYQELLDWWKARLAPAPLATLLPSRRLIRRGGRKPGGDAIPWRLEQQTAKRLDAIARGAGATHFTVRLAAFAALLADITGNATVVIGTSFDGRNRIETHNIVGRFANDAPLVVKYDASKTFLEWLQIVRDRLFETKMHTGVPYGAFVRQLQAAGVPTGMQVVFMQSSAHSEQRFGGLSVRSEPSNASEMPNGCFIYVDEQTPDNCQVNFDAGLYKRSALATMMDRYVRLIEAIAREPDLPIGKLQTKIGAKPLRWAWARSAAALVKFIKPYHNSSPLLKMCWRYARRFGASNA